MRGVAGLATIFAIWLSLTPIAAALALVDVKICPNEPQWNDTCPSACTFCENGVCVVENPAAKTIQCPENVPCRIMCFPTPSSSQGCYLAQIFCPLNASCDIRCFGGGCKFVYFGCQPGSLYSCTAQCDEQSNLGTIFCDASSACNCDNKCDLTRPCKPGFNCYGDPCWTISGLCNPYLDAFDRMEQFYDDASQSCQCRCKDPTDHYVALDNVCVPDSLYCETSADCTDHGECLRTGPSSNRCNCEGTLFRGSLCNGTCSCNLQWLQNDASSHVIGCDFTSDTCFCETGWSGTFCNISSPVPENCTVASFEAYNQTNAPSEIMAPVSDVAVAAPQSAPFICPAGCTFCDGETCVVRSIVNILFTTRCPSGNFSCRIICDGLTSTCNPFNYCDGDRPCEFVCVGVKCYSSVFYCSSTISCRAGCDSQAPLGAAGALRVYRSTTSRYVNTSADLGCPFVDFSRCRERNLCYEGSSCLPDDPCVSTKCAGATSALWRNSTKTCTCRCSKGNIQDTTLINSCRAIVSRTPSCDPPCQNGGICYKGTCACITGFSGGYCEQQVTSNAAAELALAGALRNLHSECPSSCSFCDKGTCVLSARMGDDTNVSVSCPDGWACLFICDNAFCSQLVKCENTSGPCTLLCMDYRSSLKLDYLLTHGIDTSRGTRFRATPMGSCVSTTLFCDTTATGYPCGATCVNPDVENNHFLNLTCLNHGPERNISKSQFGNDLNETDSRCWISDRCSIVSGDPCFLVKDNQAYRAQCSISTNGFELVPRPTSNSTGQMVCECACPAGYVREDIMLASGKTDVRCAPASGCSPPCQNGGLCSYTDSFMTNTRCDCFSGYSGSYCQTRCFFPVSANVTSCENGIYIISGSVNVNQSIDLVKDTNNLVELIVSGDLNITGQSNMTLSLLSANSSLTAAPHINITGQLVQNSNATIVTEVAFLPGSSEPTSSKIYVSGQAILQGTIEISLFNASSLREFLMKQPTNATTIDIIESQFVSTTISNGSGVRVTVSNVFEDECAESRIAANAVVTGTRLSVVLSLEVNQNSHSENCLHSSPASTEEVIGVNVAAAVVGSLVGAAVVATVAAVFAVPAIRERVFPFLSRREIPESLPLESLENEAESGQASPKESWTPAKPSSARELARASSATSTAFAPGSTWPSTRSRK